jgi:hypothetical protein
VKAMAGADLLAALEVVFSGKQFASSSLGDLHFPATADQFQTAPLLNETW